MDAENGQIDLGKINLNGIQQITLYNAQPEDILTPEWPFTAEELSKLPEKHNARKDPSLMVERSDIVTLDMPPFVSVLNREEVIYSGEQPRTLKAICPPEFLPQ